MLSVFRVASSSCLDEEVEIIVAGRNRTVIFVEGGARDVREVRIAVPSSPAPRTRILESKSVVIDDMVVVSRSLNKIKNERLCLIYCRRTIILTTS